MDHEGALVSRIAREARLAKGLLDDGASRPMVWES